MMFPTQLAAEAMAAALDLVWDDLLSSAKQYYLDQADAACKAIVEGPDGWRIVRTEDLTGPEGGMILADKRDKVVEVIEEWKG